MSDRNHTLFEPPSEKIKTYFQSTPWASKLFSDPSLQAFTSGSRIVKTNTTESSFITRTLATDDTIIAWQSFYKPPGPGAGPGETVAIISLGSGVNSHVDTCHGGLVSVVLDEIIGSAVFLQRPIGTVTMTASLKVDYKKPIPTPSMILCRAYTEKIEGRKSWGRGTVEDGIGTALATGEALFITVEKVKPGRKL
jgi:acyl-coenzyme A thioesterase THEM4